MNIQRDMKSILNGNGNRSLREHSRRTLAFEIDFWRWNGTREILV